MSTNDSFIELEMDAPTGKRFAAPAVEDQIELDLVDSKDPTCLSCGNKAPVNEQSICKVCSHQVTGAAVVTDFASIQRESAANAGLANLGDHAVGRATLGVGFHNAEGYLEALRRGVKKATKEEYVRTLKDRYNVTVDFEVPLLDEVVLPVGEGIVHNATGPDYFSTPEFKAKKAAQAAVAAKAQNELAVVASEDVKRVHLAHGDLVAGAVAEGNGILTHWTGAGPLTLARISELAALGGIPTEWLPKARGDKAQAKLAIKEHSLGYVVIQEKRDWKNQDQAYDARWRLLSNNVSGEAGDTAGEIALVVTLTEGVLTFAGDEILALQITDTFNDLVGREVLQAGHVTLWLANDVLRDRLGGVKYGGCWYIPKQTRVAAEAIIEAFAPSWGADWMNPPTPIATSAQLARGIANGLMAEVDELLSLLETAKANAAKAENSRSEGKLGEKAAQTFLLKFRTKAERTLAFGEILGEELVKEVKAKIAKATEELDGLLGDSTGIVERFAAMWSEVEFDIAREKAPE